MSQSLWGPHNVG